VASGGMAWELAVLMETGWGLAVLVSVWELSVLMETAWGLAALVSGWELAVLRETARGLAALALGWELAELACGSELGCGLAPGLACCMAS